MVRSGHNSSSKIIDVHGYESYNDLVEKAVELATDLYDPSSVLVLANQGDREQFVADYRAKFARREDADPAAKRLIFCEDHPDSGLGVVLFSLASEHDAE